jgi:hypothetical protein
MHNACICTGVAITDREVVGSDFCNRPRGSHAREADGTSARPTEQQPRRHGCLRRQAAAPAGRRPVAPFDGPQSFWRTIASIAVTVPSRLALWRPTAAPRGRGASRRRASRRPGQGPRLVAEAKAHATPAGRSKESSAAGRPPWPPSVRGALTRPTRGRPLWWPSGTAPTVRSDRRRC